MSFVEVKQGYYGCPGQGGTPHSGVWFGISKKASKGPVAFALYLYEQPLSALGWNEGTRVVMHLGTHVDAGIIRLAKSDEKRALRLTRDNKSTRRLMIERTMREWFLPPLPARRPQPATRWDVRKTENGNVLEIILPGAFAEELRAAQERAYARERGGA